MLQEAVRVIQENYYYLRNISRLNLRQQQRNLIAIQPPGLQQCVGNAADNIANILDSAASVHALHTRGQCSPIEQDTCALLIALTMLFSGH